VGFKPNSTALVLVVETGLCRNSWPGRSLVQVLIRNTIDWLSAISLCLQRPRCWRSIHNHYGILSAVCNARTWPCFSCCVQAYLWYTAPNFTAHECICLPATICCLRLRLL